MELLKHISKKFIEVKQIHTVNDLYNKLDINKILFDNEKNDIITIEPIDLFEEFSKKHPIYATGQQDSVEFIRVFLNDISKENLLNKDVSP